MSANNNLPSNCNATDGFLKALSCGAGTATQNDGQTAGTLFAALGTASVSAGVQMLIFLLLRMHLARIYRPRSYLVPERERVPPPRRGIVKWLIPLFNTSNLAFIQKCGLDAYFFLRYLRMLLKIFLPISVVVLPILLPINRYSGNMAGLDQLSISNVSRQYTGSRLWAHLVLAICVIAWVCYVVFRELRGYIRVRQAFLTSPQHRIRASATTVLVTGIPRKWLTLEALNGLYDVFPGGIRNIWLNRNFDPLADKVSYRQSLAKSLEDAETNLIKTCYKKHEKAEKERRKKAGEEKKSKRALKEEKDDADAAAETMAHGDGMTSDQRHSQHGLQDALHDAADAEEKRDGHERKRNAFGFMGQGMGIVGHGLETITSGVGKIVGDVDTTLQKAADTVDNQVLAANLGGGFVMDDDVYRRSMLSESEVPPTPPPKTPLAEREARLQGLPTGGLADGISAVDHNPSPESGPTSRSAMIPGGPLGQPAQGPPDIRTTGPSVGSKPQSFTQIDEPPSDQTRHLTWKFWKNQDKSLALPSPEPHTAEPDEFPLNTNGVHQNGTPSASEAAPEKVSGSKWTQKVAFWEKKEVKDEEAQDVYPDAFGKELDEDQDGEPRWRRYLEPKERETMRVPILSPTWCPSLPLIGKKVDRIYWLRRELARLNLEIEMDQNNEEKYPYMNSAFIQFNHQVAAHMACQSLSHHVPQHMAPRLVEISPDDVLWDNLSVKWWERYLRTGIVLIICVGLIILYAIPVTFTSLLSKISTLEQLKAFAWLKSLPPFSIKIIQGALPPIILSIILSLIPIIFRLLVKQQGVPTGNARELGVQQFYFAFLFIQVFLVVTITGGLVAFITALASNPTSVVSTLAKNLPKASNYFFNYLVVQAMSNSASALLQVGTLVTWFLLAPLLDSTARAKWRRQTRLQSVQWGSFFPPFTNFAVIGIIYCVIAPLILPFMLIIFSLFWIVYRYNVLYVYQFRNDTGGLLFPVAVNQLFVGLYVMELCLIGFFFISEDTAGHADCIAEGVIMIFVFLATTVYQWLLNSAFRPLFQYLPITLEDEAVIRDEEFARAQAGKFAPLMQTENDQRDIQDVAAERDEKEDDYEDEAIERERREIEERRRSRRQSSGLQQSLTPRQRDSMHRPATTTNTQSPANLQSPTNTGFPTNGQSPTSIRSPQRSWNQNQSTDDRASTWKTDRWRQAAPQAVSRIRNLAKPTTAEASRNTAEEDVPKDIEAQNKVGDALFSGYADELEDLTPDERDLLVRYAFQHSALRAKRPVVWIPRDRLGVSDDEIRRAKRMSTVEVQDDEKVGKETKTNIWMSNEGTALDGKGKVVYGRSPPDFSNVDLIVL